MTDRFNTLTVVLEKDIREDDAEHLLIAINCLKGVLSVKGNVASASDYMAEERAMHVWREKLLDLAYPKKETK
jgi:hypothetical protein